MVREQARPAYLGWDPSFATGPNPPPGTALATGLIAPLAE
jgi:hypothetical protein